MMKNYTEEELWFTEGDRRLYGLMYHPNKERKLPVMIICHGLGGTHQVNLISADIYASAGYAVCSIDFYGGSEKTKSGGRTTEMSAITEKEDLLCVIWQIRELPWIDENAVYLWGESQGAYAAALAAAEVPELIRAEILLYPALNLEDMGKDKFASKEAVTESTFLDVKLGKRYYQDIWDQDVYAEIAKYPGPVLLLHGDQDEIVPLSYSEKAAAVFKNVEYHIIHGEGHSFYNEAGRMADQMILEFISNT